MNRSMSYRFLQYLCILVAKSFVSLIPLGCREIRLPFERRKAVESSFRGSPATFQTHEPFGQNFWQLL